MHPEHLSLAKTSYIFTMNDLGKSSSRAPRIAHHSVLHLNVLHLRLRFQTRRAYLNNSGKKGRGTVIAVPTTSPSAGSPR